jgi:hypothetical protein
LGITTAAVQRGCRRSLAGLAAVGLHAVEDGAHVRVGALPHCAAAAARIAEFEEVAVVTGEQFEVIANCAHLGAAKRRQIERLCGGHDRGSLMVQRGRLDKAADPTSPHSPNVYRITATALAAIAAATLASLEASIVQGLADVSE